MRRRRRPGCKLGVRMVGGSLVCWAQTWDRISVAPFSSKVEGEQSSFLLFGRVWWFLFYLIIFFILSVSNHLQKTLALYNQHDRPLRRRPVTNFTARSTSVLCIVVEDPLGFAPIPF